MSSVDKGFSTRPGDKGKTVLGDGSKISKSALRVECYGTVDELNAYIGVIKEFLDSLSDKDREKLNGWLEAIQNDLLHLGADIASPVPIPGIALSQVEIQALDTMIAVFQKDLPRLKEFILPGGTQLAAFLHCARTVCRRAERLAVKLNDEESINFYTIPYLNRLSHLLFVMSRWVVVRVGKPEIIWVKDRGTKNLEF